MDLDEKLYGRDLMDETLEYYNLSMDDLISYLCITLNNNKHNILLQLDNKIPIENKTLELIKNIIGLPINLLKNLYNRG